MVQVELMQNLSRVERLVLHVQQLIDRGICRIGTRLHSVRDFAKRNGISPNTAAEVYDRLVAIGYVEARPRVGFFVKKDLGLAASAPENSATPIGSDPSWRIQIYNDHDRDSLDVSTGRLPSGWRDCAPIKNALKVLSTRCEHTLTEYGDPQGDLGLRKLLQSRLLDLHIPVRLPQILLTADASHATDLVVRALLKPGDTAIIESPGSHSLQNNLELQGVTVLAVSRTANGPDLVEMEEMARRHKPNFLFIQSVLHSPTGSTISLSNAHQLLKLAEEYGFGIVENDSHADMLSKYAPRLASLDQSKVLYVGSFSETLSASAHVGYICGQEATIHELKKVKAITSISGAAMTEKLIYYTLSSGDYRRSAERLRNRLAHHIQLCCNQLEDHGLELFCRPLGGKFVWTRHPRYRDAAEIARRAASQNIVIASGEAFHVNDQSTGWFRINVAFANDVRFQDFLRTL